MTLEIKNYYFFNINKSPLLFTLGIGYELCHVRFPAAKVWNTLPGVIS